jgi:hypothetical protein
MRFLLILFGVFLIGLAAWFFLREDGVVEQVTEARIEAALTANGVPQGMSECMADRLVDRLSLTQLRKLERAAPQDGESRIPVSTDDALARLRRVDDEEAVEQVVITATRCGAEALFDRL